MKALLLINVLVLLTISGTAEAGSQETHLRGLLPKAVSSEDFYSAGKPSAAKVELGNLLFFDKILSGNKNISCATCHHPKHASSDGLALPLGEGPRGLGPERKSGHRLSEIVHGRIPRNSPALFNLGAAEFTRMFHDGRVEIDPNDYYDGGFITPAKWKLPRGLENVLAAQAMFPVTSDGEMAGQKGENPIADAASLNNAAGTDGVWELLAERLRSIPEYSERFLDVFPDLDRNPENITFVHAANAIATFEAKAFRADDSPFDRFVRGDDTALSPAQLRGAKVFYGQAQCSTCHSGKFQTDHDFHAIAMPQIGPGKSDGNDGSYWRASGQTGFLEDYGRGRVTVRSEDRYKFRTPSLRNVAITGPWGHSGAFDSLEAVVRHHLDTVRSLQQYKLQPDLLPKLDRVAQLSAKGSRLGHDVLNASRVESFMMRDTWVQRQPELRTRIAAANELKPSSLNDSQVDDLVAFLHALTDPSSEEMHHLVPSRVPSGLPVAD